MWCVRMLLFAASISPLVSFSQQRSICAPPHEMEQAITSTPSVSAYDSLGAYFGKRKENACAIAMFKQALALDQTSWESHYDLGVAQLGMGDTEPALHELQRAASLHPTGKDIRMTYGTALERSHKLDEAIGEYKAVLAMDPRDLDGLYALAKALITQGGNSDMAIQLLSSILKVNPSCVEASDDLGVALSQEDRYREAAQAFKNSLLLDPSDDVARTFYLNMLIVLGDYSTAEPVAEAYLRREPDTFDAIYLAGAVEQGLGSYVAAEHLLGRAVVMEPAHYGARYRMGLVSARLGHLQEAREELQKAVQLKPLSSEAHFQLAKTLQSMGLSGEAKREFSIVQQEKEEVVKKDIATAKADLGNRALREGNPKQAAALFTDSIAEYSKSASIYYNLALALDEQHDLLGERAALSKSILLDRTFAPAHNQLGVLELVTGKLSEAEVQFQLAISYDPQYAEAQNNLGVLYGKFDDRVRAEKLFVLATENDPKYAQAFVNLGLLMASESRFVEAEHVLGTALQLSPRDSTAKTALALIRDSKEKRTK
jgi:tetratricopeptide (TPR) repeat protein